MPFTGGRPFPNGGGRTATLPPAAVMALSADLEKAWALTRTSHIIWYALSVAPFMLWLARYSSLIGDGTGEAPAGQDD